MSAEAAGRFLGGTASRVIRGSYVGNCAEPVQGSVVLVARLTEVAEVGG